jgi:uncharacterized OB-fold protein
MPGMNDTALLAAARQLLGDSSADDEMKTPDLMFQRCSQCEYLRFPPAPVCPECLSHEFGWVQDSGLGRVWSFCIYRRAFDPAFAKAVPYNVALIELDSGPRMISNVLGVDEDEIHIGLRVIAAPEKIGHNRHLVYFRTVEEEA